jgi:hypothetical protein
VDTIVLALIIAAFVVGIIEAVRTRGQSLPAWGLILGFGALLLDRLA